MSFGTRLREVRAAQSFLESALAESEAYLDTGLYCLGRFSNPHHDSPFSILLNSSRISSSSCPAPLTTSQKPRNSSNDMTPSPLTSTVLKNSLAEILPNALFQCLSASSLSISFDPSTSKIPNTSSTFCLQSGVSS